MINKSLADSCRSNYALANPFPHIVIDDFIPEDLALQCYNQMSQHQQWMFDTMEGYPEDERDSQVNKWSAGCQVHATTTGFREVMDLCRMQIDIRGWETFTYTLLQKWW